MQILYIAIIIFIIRNINCLQIAAKLKSCNTHILGACPQNSVCEEINDKTGVCKCQQFYDFNHKYKNEYNYCIYDNRSSSTTRTKLVRTTTTTTTTNSVISSNNVNNSTGGVSTPVSLPARSIPEPEHHIIGGILIPMIIVLLVIGSAYGLKRIEIVRRLREYRMRRRRQRPFYEDVMMSHENDEPPLI